MRKVTRRPIKLTRECAACGKPCHPWDMAPGARECFTCQAERARIERESHPEWLTISEFEDMTFKFGKYAGSDIQDVPLDYLEWLLADSTRRNQEIQAELDRRAMVESASMPLLDQIVHAGFRSLAKNAHPDAGGSSTKFQELQAAYERLRTILRELTAAGV